MKMFLLFLCCAAVCVGSVAQTSTLTVRSQRFDSSSVVHDSTGNIVPYKVWSPLLASGNYVIGSKPGTADSNYMVLKRLDSEGKAFAARRQPEASVNFRNGQFVSYSWKSMDGKIYTPEALKGKIVVIHISHLNHYPEIELPRYNELVDSFGAAGNIVFLCITPVKEADAKQLLATISCKYSMITDQQGWLNDNGVRISPQDIILDKEGAVYYSSMGNGTSTVVWLEKRLGKLVK